jgi:hypothetical protein
MLGLTGEPENCPSENILKNFLCLPWLSNFAIIQDYLESLAEICFR